MPEIVRFQKIDDTNREDHHHLSPADECYFVYEYTSRRDYTFSATNSLISNLKKKPSTSAHAGYHYKGRAIRQCSQLLGVVINANWLRHATLVPVPPSKANDHPDYDDRITRICKGIPCAGFNVDVRELIRQRDSIEAAHEGIRPSVSDLLNIYEIDEELTQPAPTKIAIVDDVLTAGTHFRAVHTLLAQRFPDAQIVGMFIARRVFPTDEIAFEDL